MKYLITIILSLILYGQALAKCSSSGIWAYPSKSEINQNSMIILDGYARSQRIIDSLNIGHPIYLEANGHLVKLQVLEINKGMFSLTQAILQPEEILIGGKSYKLKIENLTEWEQKLLSRWNSETGKYEPISWTVKSGIDNEIPKWQSRPKLVDKTTVWYGCGPAIYAVFDSKIEDDSQTLIKTQLVDISTNETYTYYLTLNKYGKLNVGHGMCSGAFDFKPNNKYKIRFSLTDLSGNSNAEWTEWIKFDSPFEGYK